MYLTRPKEGDIFETVNIDGHSFVIRYGYYDQQERYTSPPLPIYPNFLTNPVHTSDGYPLITRIQDACQHYRTSDASEGDDWCADCIHCSCTGNEIGICLCSHNRLPASAKEESL